jgi:hypothetical protein
VSVNSIQGIQAQDAERRDWAVAGGDWSYFLVQFLRGQRRLPIQQSEIKETQLYKRSSPAEQRAPTAHYPIVKLFSWVFEQR